VAVQHFFAAAPPQTLEAPATQRHMTIVMENDDRHVE
jgi:hypothetical protein